MHTKILYFLLAVLSSPIPIFAQKEIKCNDYITLMHKIDKLHPPVAKPMKWYPRYWGASCRYYKYRTKTRMQKVSKPLQESIFLSDSITIFITDASSNGNMDLFYECIFSKGGKYGISSWSFITDDIEWQSQYLEDMMNFLHRISNRDYSIKHSRNFKEYERCVWTKMVRVIKKEMNLFEYTAEDFYEDPFTQKIFKIE